MHIYIYIYIYIYVNSWGKHVLTPYIHSPDVNRICSSAKRSEIRWANRSSRIRSISGYKIHKIHVTVSHRTHSCDHEAAFASITPMHGDHTQLNRTTHAATKWLAQHINDWTRVQWTSISNMADHCGIPLDEREPIQCNWMRRAWTCGLRIDASASNVVERKLELSGRSVRPSWQVYNVVHAGKYGFRIDRGIVIDDRRKLSEYWILIPTLIQKCTLLAHLHFLLSLFKLKRIEDQSRANLMAEAIATTSYQLTE